MRIGYTADEVLSAVSATIDHVGREQTIKDLIADLLKGLSESELLMVKKFVEFVSYGAGLHTIETAPIDDEPETEGERAAVQEARDSMARGERGSHTTSSGANSGCDDNRMVAAGPKRHPQAGPSGGTADLHRRGSLR